MVFTSTTRSFFFNLILALIGLHAIHNQISKVNASYWPGNFKFLQTNGITGHLVRLFSFYGNFKHYCWSSSRDWSFTVIFKQLLFKCHPATMIYPCSSNMSERCALCWFWVFHFQKLEIILLKELQKSWRNRQSKLN